MTAATQPPSAVAELGLMGVVGTSAVLARPVSAKPTVERGKNVVNARRAFGGGDGGAKAEAARKEAVASARESSSAAARAAAAGLLSRLEHARLHWKSRRVQLDDAPDFPQEVWDEG